MTLTELVALVDRSARVSVPRKYETRPASVVEGTIVEAGSDAVRGQWVRVQTDDGELIESTERITIGLDVVEEVIDPS